MIQSFEIAVTIPAYRIVAVTAAQTVGFPASAQALPIGITKDTVVDTVGSIAIAGCGEIEKAGFASSVAAATLVAGDTNGLGTQFVLANTTTALTLASGYVGILLGAAATTSSVLPVYINPGFDRIGG